MERGLATVISVWVIAILMISIDVGEQATTEDGDGSLKILSFAILMALTWCKRTNCPRSSGMNFFLHGVGGF